MKVYRYKKEDEYTYALGATVVMEYLLNNPSLVQGVIFHPDFTSIEGKSRDRRIQCPTAPLKLPAFIRSSHKCGNLQFLRVATVNYQSRASSII